MYWKAERCYHRLVRHVSVCYRARKSALLDDWRRNSGFGADLICNAPAAHETTHHFEVYTSYYLTVNYHHQAPAIDLVSKRSLKYFAKAASCLCKQTSPVHSGPTKASVTGKNMSPFRMPNAMRPMQDKKTSLRMSLVLIDKHTIPKKVEAAPRKMEDPMLVMVSLTFSSLVPVDS